MASPFNVLRTNYLLERQDQQTYQSGYPVRTEPVYYTTKLSVQAVTSSLIESALVLNKSQLEGRELAGDLVVYGNVDAQLVEATEFADHLIAFGKKYYIKNNFLYVNNPTVFRNTHHFMGIAVEDGKASQSLKDFLGENLRITTTSKIRVVP